MTKERIRLAISKSNLKEALNLLLAMYQSKDMDTAQVINLQGRYSAVRNQYNVLGLMTSSEASVERNRISAAVLELANEVDESTVGVSANTLPAGGSHLMRTGLPQNKRQLARILSNLRDMQDLDDYDQNEIIRACNILHSLTHNSLYNNIRKILEDRAENHIITDTDLSNAIDTIASTRTALISMFDEKTITIQEALNNAYQSPSDKTLSVLFEAIEKEFAEDAFYTPKTRDSFKSLKDSQPARDFFFEKKCREWLNRYVKTFLEIHLIQR